MRDFWCYQNALNLLMCHRMNVITLMFISVHWIILFVAKFKETFEVLQECRFFAVWPEPPVRCDFDGTVCESFLFDLGRPVHCKFDDSSHSRVPFHSALSFYTASSSEENFHEANLNEGNSSQFRSTWAADGTAFWRCQICRRQQPLSFLSETYIHDKLCRHDYWKVTISCLPVSLLMILDDAIFVDPHASVFVPQSLASQWESQR